MRIERKGPVERLTPRLVRFILEALGGEALDDIQHSEARKADYRCLGGLLVIELKSLEEDASERMDNLTDELRQRPDWPYFLGSAPILSILKHMDGPENLKRRLVDRIGRAIKSHMRKADKQLAAHEATFPRKNLVKIVILVNEDHEIYDPALVMHIAHHLLSRQENGVETYHNIDAVLFFSERHAASVDNQIAFPISCIEGQSIEKSAWKKNVVDTIVTRWAEWRGISLYWSKHDAEDFTTIEHIPDKMKRYEQWELEYRRRPYMRKYTEEQLRQRFDEIICVGSLAFIKDSPLRPSDAALEWCMSGMTHITQEMGWRAIPATQFKQEPERLASAAKRLGLQPNVVEWVKGNIGRKA